MSIAKALQSRRNSRRQRRELNRALAMAPSTDMHNELIFVAQRSSRLL